MIDFLRDLSPSRAFYLFSGTLAAGICAISIDNTAVRLAVPTLLLALYGVLLWTSQTRFHVSHSYEVKTSPYILGFILTLVALFLLFWRFGSAITSGSGDADLIVSHAGTAILTTVVGLFLRQLLIASDPDEHRQDEVFQSLSQTLREHASEFDRGQKALVVLIKEFVGTREELFSREEDAFQKYISQLERSSALTQKLNDAAEPNVNRVAIHFETVQQGLQQWRDTINDTARGMNHLRDSLTQTAEVGMKTKQQLADFRGELANFGALQRTLNTQIGSVVSDVREAGDAVAAFKDTRSRLLDQEGSAIKKYISGIEQGTELLRSLHDVAGPSVGNLNRDIETWKATVNDLTTTIDGLRDSLTQAASSGLEVTGHLATMRGEFSDMVALQKGLNEGVRSIVEDIAKMDGVVDEVSKLLQKRIQGT